MRTILALCAAGMLTACGVMARSPEFSVKSVGEDSIRTASVDAQFEMAKYHLSRHNDALAIEILRRVKRDRPSDVRVLNALGVAYDRIGRYETSRQYYEAALGAEPGADYVVHNLAYSFELQGLHAEARALYARAESSTDTEVRGRAIEFAATTAIEESFSNYKPLRYQYAGHITRMTSKVQNLSWNTKRSPGAMSIGLDTSLALLAATDDYTVSGNVSKSGGLKAEWEILVAAALQSSQETEFGEPAAQSAMATVSRTAMAHSAVTVRSPGNLGRHRL